MYEAMEKRRPLASGRTEGAHSHPAVRHARLPARLPEQPIFYPVLSEAYARKIARDWNVAASGAGYVTRFRVRKDFLDRYQVQEAGGKQHLEYWIPAEDLAACNAAIIGEIEVIAEYPQSNTSETRGE
jgi:hypothetical protein